MSNFAQNQHLEQPNACHVAVVWIDWYAYHLARFGGLESAFGSKGQVAGIELVGGVGVHSGYKFREEHANPHIETLFPNGSWRGVNKLRMSIRLWRRLTDLNPAIVLAPGYYTLPGIAAALWARLHRKISVLMTESTESDLPRVGWKESVKSAAIRFLFDWAVTGGAAHVRYLKKLRFPENKIAHFYNVVGNQRITEGVSQLRRNRAEPPRNSFLFVGRLAPEKNVIGLLRAWIAYRESGGTWPLVLAGDGPEAAALRAIAAESRWPGEVTFAGHKTSEELLPFFSDASCFVLPSSREPWGLVVNEAMAASLPVIVSNRCGCAEDLVNTGINGLVFDAAQKGELISCLRFMEQRSDEELWRMGQASLERISLFSPANFGREIARIAGSTQSCAVTSDLSTERTA